VALHPAHDRALVALEAQHVAPVTHALAIQRQMGVAPEKLHDVRRGVWADPRQINQEVAHLVIRRGRVHQPLLVDVSGDEELRQLDDPRIAITHRAAGAQQRQRRGCQLLR